jgi:hypothetical protein
MAALQADELNEAFLKNFFTETLYALPEETLTQPALAPNEAEPVQAPAAV